MAGFEKIVQELTKLKTVTRPRSLVDDDLDLQYAAMARGLVDLPDAAIAAGCDAWGLQSPWFPTLCELRGECLQFHKPPALPKPPQEQKPWQVEEQIPPEERARVASGLRRLAKVLAVAQTGDDIGRMMAAPGPVESPEPKSALEAASSKHPAATPEQAKRLRELHNKVQRRGGVTQTVMFRQRARHRSPDRQIAMLEDWIARHEAARAEQAAVGP